MGAITIDGVVKRFGSHAALDDVALEVPSGEIHAVIGPNGAGKSTLFSVIAGQHVPERGTVTLDGRDITRMKPARRVRLGIARAFQVARVFPQMSVLDNVATAAIASSGSSAVFWHSRPLRPARERALRALREIGLEDHREDLAGGLAQGDRKRLELGMVLVMNPEVLLLDEPTAGMSPQETSETVTLVRELWQRHGLTVLLTEHDMQVVFGLASRLTVLNFGTVLASGDPQEIRGRRDVIDVYLGHGDDPA